jgi:hypothetical protein
MGDGCEMKAWEGEVREASVSDRGFRVGWWEKERDSASLQTNFYRLPCDRVGHAVMQVGGA